MFVHCWPTWCNCPKQDSQVWATATYMYNNYNRCTVSGLVEELQTLGKPCGRHRHGCPKVGGKNKHCAL